MLEDSLSTSEIQLSETTVLRLGSVLGVADGAAIAVDVRLYRRTAGGVTYGPTSAGLRIPLHALPAIAAAFAALARTHAPTPGGGK